MASFLDMAGVIEPSVGAGERRAEGRSGVHQLWASDEYRNVWWLVPLDALGHSGIRDPASIDTARALLRRIKAHADPVLKHYGWTVKHLHEHVGGPGGMCYHDGQGTADISLQLRAAPSKACNQFRPFASLMRVMLHEMTHIHGLGVEDIHPPEFYEKMREVIATYRRLLARGMIVEADGDARGDGGDGGALGGEVVHGELPEGGCRRGRLGERKRGRRGRAGAREGTGRGAQAAKRPALGKKRSMIDKRTTEGKRLAAEQAASTPAEAARSAALARFGQAPLSGEELRTRALRAPGVGTSVLSAIELSDDEGVEEQEKVEDGGTTHADDEEEEEEEEEEDEDGVELHDGPPGMCACEVCANVALAFRGAGGRS